MFSVGMQTCSRSLDPHPNQSISQDIVSIILAGYFTPEIICTCVYLPTHPSIFLSVHPSFPSSPLISVLSSMSHSFGESYRVGSTKGIHALTVFCSWDYKVTQKRASRVQQDSIRTQLKVSSYLSHTWLPSFCRP